MGKGFGRQEKHSVVSTAGSLLPRKITRANKTGKIVNKVVPLKYLF